MFGFRIDVFGRITVALVISGGLGAAVSAQEKITYQDHILPLVENSCGKCHNPDKKKADLDLTSYASLLKGNGSGPVVVAGNPDSSKLWKAITHAEEPTMPPNKPKMPDKELEVWRKWIAGGLLETTGSKAIVSTKPAVDFTLKNVSIGKPDGPPPMPKELSIEPVVHAERLTALTGLAHSPWAPLLALAGEKQVLLYNTDTLELLGIFPFTEGFPVDLKFSRNGKLLVAGGGRGGKSGRVLVWDVTTGERLMTIGDEYDTVLGADISADQTQIALGGPGRLVKIYSTKTGELLHKKKKHTDWVTAVAFSPNGELLATADRNGSISIWDPDNGQEIHTLAGHKAGVTGLGWRVDSKLLASSSEDGTVKIWELQDGKVAKTIEAHKGGALSVAYTQDGRLLSSGRDNQITLWTAEGSKIRSYDFSGEIALRAVISQDGARIVGTDFAGHVVAWKTADGKRIGEFDPNPSLLADQLAAAQKRADELHKQPEKAADLSAARAAIGKLKAAQAQAALFKSREAVGAKKREHEKLVAFIAEKKEAIKQAEEAVSTAPDSAAKAKAKAALKAVTAETKEAESAAKKCAADLSTEQARLNKLTAEYEKVKTASSGAVRQSKL